MKQHPLGTDAMMDRLLGDSLREDIMHCVAHEYSVAATDPSEYSDNFDAIAAISSLHVIRDLLGMQLGRAYDDCVKHPYTRQRMREMLEMISAKVQMYQKDLELWETS